MSIRKWSIVSALIAASTTSALSAEELSVQGGLSQPLLGGGNVAVTYYGDDFLFDYSHGWNLDFGRAGGAALNADERRQQLSVVLPYTTGFGIGYRITRSFDIRIEFKEHFYRVTHPDNIDQRLLFDQLGLRSSLPLNSGAESALEALYLASAGGLPVANRNEFLPEALRKTVLQQLLYGNSAQALQRTIRYRTRSVGIGLYYRWHPWSDDASGIMIEPSIRFWPNVWTDLSGGRIAFENKDGISDVHRAHDQGLFFNVSLGYTWKL